MIDKDAHALDPPLKRLGVPIFDLRELREREGSVLGRGAFGVVRSIEGYPGLAVKEVRLDGLGGSALQSLRFELATLTTFTHPGILRCHQVLEDEDGDLIYIVMDRHDASLETLIMKHRRRREPVSAETIVALTAQITGALAYLHGFCGTDVDGRPYQGVIHRDLKPANILVSEDGNRLVLADFGLCRSAMASGTTRAGSPAYMAPETLLEGKATPASDIWALGVIVYELATLKRPNFTTTRKPEDVFVSGWRPNLDAIEDDFIRGILERIFVPDPAKRLTAKDLHEIINPSISSTGMLRLRVASLEDALGAADARINAQSVEISTLRRDLATKSSAIDSLKQQFTNIVKNLTKMTCLALMKDSSWTPLMCAAVAGDIETAKRHLNEVDERNNDGDTAYTLAAKAGQGAILELLDPTDYWGVTALMRAAETGEVEAVKALIPLQKGRKTTGFAHINRLWTPKGGTALMIAAKNGHTEVVRLLVEHEGDMRDSEGCTALMFAAHSGHADCAKLLLEKEGGMKTNYGWTALMYATRNHQKDCIRLLLDKEGGMQDKDGWTALMIAAKRNHLECVKLLLEKEKDIKSTQEWDGYPPGTTALDIAKKMKHTAIASILSE